MMHELRCKGWLLLTLFCMPCFGAKHVAPAVRWAGSWASSQQIPEPENTLPAEYRQDATLRQVVHLSTGGSVLRIHLSNAFGQTALHLTTLHIARPAGSGMIDAASDRPVLFAGKPEVTIPPGAEFISDAIAYPVSALADLAVTLHLDAVPAIQTGHPGSHATSYVAAGDHVAAMELDHARRLDHWYILSGVDVQTSDASAVVAFGDSITDGHGSTANGNDRWPDDLARRLQAAMPQVSVLNQGIGGNHLLTDGLGPNALARFDRDVLAQAGVRTVILLEGINDLGALSRDGLAAPEQRAGTVERILAAYGQIVERAHAHGIRVIGATMTPYVGSDYYHPFAENEADRRAVNQWIRTAGIFDGVIDFDKVLADPAHPEQMLPAYDSGDHLHPSPAGYKAMADAIPITLLKQ